MEGRTRSRPEHLWVEGVHTVVHQDQGPATCSIGRSDDGPRIAWVTHLPEGGNQVRASLTVPLTVIAWHHQIGRVDRHPPGITLGDNPLGIRADGLHDPFRYRVYVYVVVLQGILGNGCHDRIQKPDTPLARCIPGLHIEVRDQVGSAIHCLPDALRSFDQKALMTLPGPSFLELGKPAYALRTRVIHQGFCQGHTHHSNSL